MNAIMIMLLIPAAGWSTTERSIEAMGTGGTGAARTHDPGANVYNAAAGLMEPGLSVSAGLVLAAPALQAESDAFSSSTQRELSTPPLAHVRWSGETFGLGASFSVPFGSQVVWPKDWAGRFELTEARLRVLRTEAFIGAHFGDLSVAGGAFFDVGQLAFVRALDFVEAEGETRIDTRATGIGGQASIFYRPFDALDLGLSYQSRSRLSFSGWADFSVPVEFAGRASDQEVRTTLIMPDRFRLGALYRVTDTLELSADLELLLWNTVQDLTLDFASEQMEDTVQPREWRPTVTPRVGAAWQALSMLEVRGGLYVDPSPVPGRTVGPSSPDSTRVGLSVGLGADLYAGIGLDVAYQLLIFTGAESEAATLSGVRYDGLTHLFGAAVRLQL